MKNLFTIQLPRMIKSCTSASLAGLCRRGVWLALAVALLPGLAQAQNVTLSASGQRVDAVLRQLEAQTDYKFFYNTDQIDLARRVNVQAANRDLFAVLEDLFRGTNVTWSVLDRNIVLATGPASAAKAGAPTAADDNQRVSGKVMDAAGRALPGAMVTVAGTTRGVSAGADGSYVINAPKGSSLQFSFMGYLTETKAVTPTTVSMAVTLHEDFQKLDEVVVVGYGTQRRSDLTGAISSVTPEKLNTIPVSNVVEMLRGKAAGIQVNTTNAAPGGGGAAIYIRGKRTLSGGDNQPLYVVDGVPTSNIDDVNSTDIASLEVLKDASAQSIYGARAACGVILITTKRGKAGQTKINYSNYFAMQDIKRNFEFYNGYEWAAMRKEAYYNANGSYDPEDCFRGVMYDVLQSGNFVDWEKEMIGTALQQKHDISIQSGTDRTKYSISFGYFDQDGMVPSSGYQRATGRLNVDHQLNKWLTLGTNVSYMRSWTRTADGSFNNFITVPPLSKIYEDDGVTLRKDVTEAGESNYNPLWNINNSDNRSIQERILLNLFADVKITKDITYRVNGSISRYNTEGGTYQGVDHTSAYSSMGKGTTSISLFHDYLLENILTWSHDFCGKKHHVEVTGMQSVNTIQRKTMGINATEFANDELTFNGVGGANSYGEPTWNLTDRSLVSFMGRVNYGLLGRYLFSAAIRADGSTVFGINNKWGYFPSASFAWRASEEAFLRDVNWLSNLKLRLSYGQTGNQGVDPYETLGVVDKYLTEFGTEKATGYLPNAVLPNPDLKWETSTTANIGLDFGFLKGRISGTAEIYTSKTTDLLMSRYLSRVLGYKSQVVNVGELRNRGVEITLNTVPVRTRSFSWEVDLTFAANSNKILKLDGTTDEYGNPTDNVASNWFIGKPTNVYYDYRFAGIWQLTDDISSSYMPGAKPGTIRVANTNGDDIISDADKVVYQRDPKWIGNLGTTLRWKGFDLSADLYVAYGGTIYNDYLVSFANGGDLTGKRNGIRRNYWTANNPSNEAPAPHFTQAPAYLSSLGYQDGTYVRLRNVTLGYEFPERWMRKIFVQKLRLYTSLTNFWTRTDVLGYGPEQNPGAYPEPRTALVGLNVTF